MSDAAARVVEALRSVAPWIPIPLFAESLRAQRELISAVMTLMLDFMLTVVML